MASLSRSVTGCIRSLRGLPGSISVASVDRRGSAVAGSTVSTTASRFGEPAASPAPGSAPSTKALAAGLSSASKRRLLGGRADGAGGVLISGDLLVEGGNLAAGIGVDDATQHRR